MKSKEVGELRKKREETIVIDKGVGGSCEMLNDGTVETIQVEKKDAATDALHIKVEDKVFFKFIFFTNEVFIGSVCLPYHQKFKDNYLFTVLFIVHALISTTNSLVRIGYRSFVNVSMIIN